MEPEKTPATNGALPLSPVKFGIGDPRAERNSAAVIVQVLADGSVTVRAGLVDLNDGLNRQIQEEVSAKLGVDESSVHIILNDFDSLPRATPVIGTDAAGLVLRALDDACAALRRRLREVALQLFAAKGQTEIELESIRFSHGVVGPDITPTDPLHFTEVVEGAWRKRVNLIETGYHRTPNLWVGSRARRRLAIFCLHLCCRRDRNSGRRFYGRNSSTPPRRRSRRLTLPKSERA